MNKALVLGMSIHGLAVARALGKAKIPTRALAAINGPRNYTRYATVSVEPSVNLPSLPSLLLSKGAADGGGEKVILFPTNDNMVREIGLHWDSLQEYYAVSWQNTVNGVLDFQRKDKLPEVARKAGVNHPRSVVVRSRDDIREVTESIGYPCIVKPAKPLSSFKVKLVHDEPAFLHDISEWEMDLPLVAQEQIVGKDTELFFYSSVWASGAELCGRAGRKIKSIPPGMGQGTILETGDFPDVLKEGRKFAQHLEIDGPISVEFKRNESGQYVMIEPNVGRTEYCVDLMIQSGFNMPLTEYLATCGRAPVTVSASERRRSWYDTEKDPLGYVRDAWECRSIYPRGTKPIFPYAGHKDPLPWLMSFLFRFRDLLSGGVRRTRKLLLERSRAAA